MASLDTSGMEGAHTNQAMAKENQKGKERKLAGGHGFDKPVVCA